MRRHRRQLNVISDLNLTNLLDTAFVLLIAFMLVSPVIRMGIDLQLPKVTQAPIQIDSESKSTLTISIRKKQIEGAEEPIYVDGERRVTMEELREIIEQKKAGDPKLAVVVEGDTNASFGPVAKVLGMLKNMGIANVGIPTDPEDAAPAREPKKKK